MTEIVEHCGYPAGLLSRWLDRLERLIEEQFEEAVSEEPREARPSELFDGEYGQFVTSLREPPEKVGLDASVRLPSESIFEITTRVRMSVRIDSIRQRRPGATIPWSAATRSRTYLKYKFLIILPKT